jgi:alpha-tubulin suppressor-like RCC1 family protein
MKLLRQRAGALALLLLAPLGVGLPAQGAGPMLSIHRDGSNVMVSFTALLQSASRPEGPYATVFGATSPFVWPVSDGPGQFWRAATAGGGTFSAGDWSTIALKTDGSLWSWGLNDFGQLGAPGPGDWISVGCGHLHTMALKANGALWGWGNNYFGQLGIGSRDNEPHYQPVQVGLDVDWAAVACGFGYTMALKADGTLWAWGGSLCAEMGTADTNQPARVGSDTNWIRVACGPTHTIALKEDGSLWAWGSNLSGQLGIGTWPGTSQPVRVGADADWQAVACGGYPDEIWLCFPGHTVALKTDGSLWAWGDDFYGQLGIGTNDYPNQPARVGADADWQAVACGAGHTVALKANGSLWAWGNNRDGQLGNGTFESTNQPVRVGSDTNWIRVACGWGHTIALKADGTLWGWGDNGYGQLGGGTFGETNQPVQIGSDTDWAR